MRPVLFLAITFAPLWAQACEVASVKFSPEIASSGGMRINACVGGPGSSDPSRYTCRGLTLRRLIEIADRMTSADVSGPGWIESNRYDIVAKPPVGATAEQIEPMLRAYWMSSDELAFLLSGQLDRPVQDLTGIAGAFAMELDFAKDISESADQDALRPPEARKGMSPFVIVEDALQKPRENS
jgi:hypothetical protein